MARDEKIEKNSQTVGIDCCEDSQVKVDEDSDTAHEEQLEEDVVEELPTELEKIKSEMSELKEKFLRLAAEYDNYRKRSEREKNMIYSDATICTLLPLLPIFDTIDRASDALKDCDEQQKKGFEMVQNQISDILKKMEITTIGKIGEKFDPNLHNAVSHSSGDKNFGENTVSMVLQKGYLYNGKLVRPAMVQVAN